MLWHGISWLALLLREPSDRRRAMPKDNPALEQGRDFFARCLPTWTQRLWVRSANGIAALRARAFSRALGRVQAMLRVPKPARRVLVQPAPRRRANIGGALGPHYQKRAPNRRGARAAPRRGAGRRAGVPRVQGSPRTIGD